MSVMNDSVSMITETKISTDSFSISSSSSASRDTSSIATSDDYTSIVTTDGLLDSSVGTETASESYTSLTTSGSESKSTGSNTSYTTFEKSSSLDAESSILEYQVHPIQREATDTEKRLARYQALDEQFGDLIASYSEQKPLRNVRESHYRGEEKSNAFSRGIPMKFYDRVRLKTLSRPLKFEPIDFETRRDLLIQSYLS